MIIFQVSLPSGIKSQIKDAKSNSEAPIHHLTDDTIVSESEVAPNASEIRSGVTEDNLPLDNVKQGDSEVNASVDEVHFIFLEKMLITVTSMQEFYVTFLLLMIVG